MIKINTNRRFVSLAFMSAFLLFATLGNSFMTQAPCAQATISDSITPFPQVGEFYTLAGRAVLWEIVGEKNITSHEEEINKWSIQDVVDDVAFVNRTYVVLHINPETGVNYTDTCDFDYEIATNRTILSAYWKWMSFTTTGFWGSGGRSLDEDVGEHTWAWFPMDLHIGAYVLVGWSWDHSFLGDMLYEVVGEETIQILGEKQDCWILRMPPSTTIDGARVHTETYWVDKDTGVPLKLYGKEWAVDGSSGWAYEDVLTHTNIDLGPESTQPPSPTYTLIVPTTRGFPEAGKFYTWYYLDEGWYMSGATNVTWYADALFSWWVVNVTDDEALVYRIMWYDRICEAEGVEELEAVEILYFIYSVSKTTREILDAAGSSYVVNMSSLTYVGPEDLTSLLAGDIGEETYCWLPTDLYVGATVNISWTFDRPWKLDNATYTVVDEEIISALSQPQACWVLHLLSTSSIDGTWNYSETYYSDKDAGVALGLVGESWAVDGRSAYSTLFQTIDTNVDLGPQTYVFPVVADSQTFHVVVITNSTILTDTFNFSQGAKEISYNVTEASGTAGFCNITIPMALLRGTPWTVKVDNTTVTFTVTDNTTHTFLYFNYNHSIRLVQIIGTWVIPEFPALIILPLFMIATLLAVIVYRRKHSL